MHLPASIPTTPSADS
ncbi:unnamed protein product, partial [Rotaria socialis]